MVEERAACKLNKDYSRADALREQCATMGIKIRDDRRTWYMAKTHLQALANSKEAASDAEDESPS